MALDGANPVQKDDLARGTRNNADAIVRSCIIRIYTTELQVTPTCSVDVVSRISIANVHGHFGMHILIIINRRVPVEREIINVHDVFEI